MSSSLLIHARRTNTYSRFAIGNWYGRREKRHDTDIRDCTYGILENPVHNLRPSVFVSVHGLQLHDVRVPQFSAFIVNLKRNETKQFNFQRLKQSFVQHNSTMVVLVEVSRKYVIIIQTCTTCSVCVCVCVWLVTLYLHI